MLSHRKKSAPSNDLTEGKEISVALVTTPFVSIWHPSIQLGLLGAVAKAHGFTAETYHLHLEFAAQIGKDLYQALCQQRLWLVSDWLFSFDAFGSETPDEDDAFLKAAPDDVDTDLLRKLRYEAVPEYLDKLEKTIEWHKFDVVGFSSMFQQNTSSLALARRLKEKFPAMSTLFGGANFDAEMGHELVRTMPAIDYAISGEADEAFPEFLTALASGRDPATISGIVCRRDGQVSISPPRAPFDRLNALPFPDYDEFFQRIKRLNLLEEDEIQEINLPFESARGCWWGQKHHCTFCGLNGATMAFRAKSSGRVLEEMAALSSRYRIFRFDAADNILDPAYFKGLFPVMKDKGFDYQIFYEVKANLKREQVKLLKEVGVNRIQPGIESLSTPVLKLMRKGVSAIQNVNLLRWARYYEIEASWNLIWGFPEETEDDCQRQCDLIPSIRHLEPPLGRGRIWLERFSPLFRDRAAFPARKISPAAGYDSVYPDSVDLEKIAYFFDYELENVLPDRAYAPLEHAVDAWLKCWDESQYPTLTFWRSPDLVQIKDARSSKSTTTYDLEGPLADLYSAFSERPLSAAAAKSALEWPWPTTEIEGSLDQFCDKGLMMEDNGLYLSLALPAIRGR